MFKLQALQLTGYHLWHDLEFKFQEGLTFVTGRNKSGKSLLFSSLPSILYDADFVPSNSKATLSFDNEQHSFAVSAFNQSNAKHNKLELSIDGRSQKTETRAAALNLIEQYVCSHVPLSLFQTSVSISGLSEHPLSDKRVKDGQRLEWIQETLAFATVIDTYLERAEKLLKTTRDDSVKFTLLKSQLDKLERVEKPKQNFAKIKESIAEVTELLKNKSNDKRDIEHALEFSETQVEKPSIPLDEAERKLTAMKAVVKYHQELKPLYESYEKDLESWHELQDEIAKYKDAYKEACADAGLKAINPSKQLEEIAELVSELEEKLSKAQRINNTYEQQTEMRELAESNIPIQWPLERDYTNRIKDLRELIAINSSQLKFIDGDARHCPMCGSNKSHVHNKAELKSQKDKAEKRLALIEEEYEVWKARQIKFVKRIDTNKIIKEIKALGHVKEAAKAYLLIKKHDIDKPEQVPYSADTLAKAEKKVTFYADAVLSAKIYEESKHSSLPKSNPYKGHTKKELRRLLHSVSKDLEELSEELEDLNDKLLNAKTSETLFTQFINTRTQLIEEARPLKQANSDNRLLAVAKKALGRDGFRMQRLSQTLELFVDNLNTYAPLIWDEPIKFEIDANPKKAVIIAHRNNKAGTTSTFSGSERRCWQALTALSMLRLLPNNRQFDTIIMDEIDANMDPHNRAKFIKEFIPEIQKTVDKVIVVSPLPKKELGINPDRGYFVEKHRNKSRLIDM